MSFVTVAVIGASIMAGSAAVKAVDGAIQAKSAKDLAKQAKIDLDMQKNQFAQLDTSNPYLNMENTMEDLTVNTQQAEFAQQQSMQNQANVMQSMQGAAGGSGIAALAQTMASQGSVDAQKASASIGAQESNNMMAEAKMAGRIQGQERQGDLMSRQMQSDKLQSLMGMTADELANHRKQQQDSKDQMFEGIAEFGEAGMQIGGSLME
tara:strand:- start:29 stop:652 length:624 start_codon:yes stop_codon:yes gene_type:complete